MLASITHPKRSAQGLIEAVEADSAKDGLIVQTASDGRERFTQQVEIQRGGAVKTMGKPRENGELTNKHWDFMGFKADLCWFMEVVYISLWIQTLSKKVLHPPNHTPNTS